MSTSHGFGIRKAKSFPYANITVHGFEKAFRLRVHEGTSHIKSSSLSTCAYVHVENTRFQNFTSYIFHIDFTQSKRELPKMEIICKSSSKP